jgi:hypothetical protein
VDDQIAITDFWKPGKTRELLDVALNMLTDCSSRANRKEAKKYAALCLAIFDDDFAELKTFCENVEKRSKTRI